MADGIQIDERWVPFPHSVSERARELLASMVGPDGVPLRVRPAPAPDDFDAWVAFRDESNRRLVEAMAPVAAQLPADTRTEQIGGAQVHIATPHADHHPDHVYLEFHGGGFYAGGGEFSRIGAMLRAVQHGAVCYGVDYRKPPEHPYPAGLDDSVAVYRALLADHDPGEIIVGGVSAGANLAAATVLRARDEGLPLPAAAVLMTPAIDLTESGDSFAINRLLDVWLPTPLPEACRLYAGGHDLTDPYLSPLFGDFSPGFPPTFVQAGTRDLLLSNAARMHQALRRADVPVELHVTEAMPHGGFGGAPEDLELAAEVARFVAAHWR